MVISPGPEPMTRHAKLTTIESACENRFYTQDLKNADRKGIAIVLAHNASNHYCPTVIISQREYVTWQLEYVGLMASSTLTLISEVDRNNCNTSQKAILEKLDTTLAQAVRSFGGSTKPISSATGHAKDVMFSQVQPCARESSTSTQSNPPPAGTKEKGRKVHNCPKCTYYTMRKEDLDNHMGYKHQIGKMHFCYIGKCKKSDGSGTQKSSKKNLRQHIRQQHKGIYLYQCEVMACDYKTDSQGLLKTHMVRVHGEDKEKEYKCEKCGKVFDGDNLLQKHQKTDKCGTQKNFSCDQCTPSKWFKSRESMMTHIKIYHTGEISKVKCNECGKLFGTKQSLEQHEIIHRGLAVLKKAKAQTQALHKKVTTGPIAKKRKGQPMSKSAPAKLIKSSSPRTKRGGKSQSKVTCHGQSK